VRYIAAVVTFWPFFGVNGSERSGMDWQGFVVNVRAFSRARRKPEIQRSMMRLWSCSAVNHGEAFGACWAADGRRDKRRQDQIRATSRMTPPGKMGNIERITQAAKKNDRPTANIAES
jgi:hypothetical protein